MEKGSCFHLVSIKIMAVVATAFLFILTGCHKKPIPGSGGNGTDTIIIPVPASFTRVKPLPAAWDNNKRSDLTYQLLVYSFADANGDHYGDFKGLKDKLDYIDSLGASAVWLSPIHPSMSYHGYDVTDYATVNTRYGSMDDFKDLVQAAHRKNIKVYLDYVLNHSGSKHPWFTDACRPDSPYRDYYIFSQNPKADIAAGKIPMIATEGANGYDSGQWFTASSAAGGFLEFNLDWTTASAPTITVYPCSEADADNTAADTATDKWLYYGNGVQKKFYALGGNRYKLRVNFISDWGFLIRTTTDNSWPGGTKYGARQASAGTLVYGQAFTLFTHTDNSKVNNVLLPGSAYFHSHFWTDWFADFNYGSADTCERSASFKALTDIAKAWIDAGVDGFRLDAVKHIYHNAATQENPVFLKKFYDVCNAHYRKTHNTDIYMVGEVFSEHNEAAPYYSGLPALFEFSFWWRLQNCITTGTGCTFCKQIRDYEAEYARVNAHYIEATKLSNHDEDRARSGLRSVQQAKLAGAVLLTAAGQPYVYYGEELGYTGTKSNGDEYVRQPMLWGDSYTTSYTDKIDPAFAGSVASVARQASDTTSVLTMYRRFARARNRYPALARGTMEPHDTYNETRTADYPGIAAWYRVLGTEKVLVLHNFGAAPKVIALTDNLKNCIVCNGAVYTKKDKNIWSVKMEGLSSVVFEL